jgi:hypothetical protein
MKAEQSDRLAQAIEDLAQGVEENTGELQAVREAIGELRDFGELKAVRDAIDDLRIEYEHAFRNGTCPYLAEAQAAAEAHPNQQLELIAELIRLSITEGFVEALDRAKKRRGRGSKEDGGAVGLTPELTQPDCSEEAVRPGEARRTEEQKRHESGGNTLF